MASNLPFAGPQPDIPFLVPDHLGPILPSNLSVAGVAISVVFGIAAIAAVGIRFWAHCRTKAGIAVDAYLILVALILAIGICVLTTWASMCAGLGWPLEWEASPAGLRFQKGLDAGQILWGVSIACIRASILCFYRRIFTIKSFRRATTAVQIINILWLVAYTIVTSVSYTNHGADFSACDYPSWLIANGCLDITQDVIVLCLPLLVIPKLKMSRHRKIGLAALLWLGAFCVIASIVRIVLFIKIAYLPDTDRYFAYLISECAIWTTIQPCTSIIAACLPTYGPLLRGSSNWVTRGFSRFKSFLQSSRQGVEQCPKQKSIDNTAPRSERDVYGSWDRLHDADGYGANSNGFAKVEQVFEMEGETFISASRDVP